MPDLSLTNLEALVINSIREFPKQEQLKIFDLFSRFLMAKQYTGELKFDFNWLLDAEQEYDPVIDPELDVLKEIGGE